MGRNINFDRAVVLQNAMSTFWKNGFKDTSLDDISIATGLKKPSLYNTFGNKEDLFIESLKLYKNLMQKRLDSYPKGVNFISHFFEALFKEEKDGTLPNGCLIMNSAIEFSKSPDNDKKKELTSLSWNMLRDYFKQSIIDAKKENTIKSNINPEQFSIWLITQTYSIRGFARMSELAYCEEVMKHIRDEIKKVKLTKKPKSEGKRL